MKTSTKLLNKIFLLFILGWELSMIGEALLRFTLPLYLFLATGNSILLGSMLALSAIPSILLTPLGGILADRISKRKIIMGANAVLVVMTLIYLLTFHRFDLVVFTTCLLLIIFSANAVLEPSAEAAIPLLVPKEKLETANGMTFLLTIFSSVGAPILAGFILENYRLIIILWLSILLFLGSVLIMGLARVPFTKNVTYKVKDENQTIRSDLKEGFHFVRIEKPPIGRVILLMSLLSMTIAPIMSVGLTVLVSGYFGRGEATLGIAQGLVVFGGTVGVIFIGILGKRANVNLFRKLIFVMAGVFIPFSAILYFSANDQVKFITTIVSFFILLSLITLVTIIGWTYLGKNTPENLLGKIMGLNSTIIAIGVALGNGLWGMLTRVFIDTPGIAMIIIGGLTLLIGIFVKVENDV